MSNGPYTSGSAPVSQVYTNTSQEIIQITDDKLRLILTQHLAKAEKRKDWIAPFSLFLTVVTVFASADFRPAFGFPAETLRAIFLFLAAGSLIWFLVAVVAAFKSPSLDDLIKRIKN